MTAIVAPGRENFQMVAGSIARSAWLLLFAAWLVALVSTLGALFVGEILGQTPCQLCWYQRIAMFPLAAMLGIACLADDVSVKKYALPLALAGAAIAFWHMGVFFGIVPQAIEPCGAGPSCSGSEMTVLGGLPLPVASAVAFSAISLLLIGIRREEHR
jgi:disulfide bond formation protein DsbB